VTSHPREEEVALYSTGELDESERRAIAEHVAVCRECRECLAQFREMEHLLKSAAAEPSERELLEVRQGVAQALEGTRKRRVGFEWASAIAALITLIVLLGYQQRVDKVIPPAPKIAVVHAPAIASAPSISAQRVLARRRPRAPGWRSIALVTPPGEEPFIRIATADPKVIILLPPDARNQERKESNDE
jgi:anti-sigma factor ChrR (cupin superfamily)